MRVVLLYFFAQVAVVGVSDRLPEQKSTANAIVFKS